MRISSRSTALALLLPLTLALTGCGTNRPTVSAADPVLPAPPGQVFRCGQIVPTRYAATHNGVTLTIHRLTLSVSSLQVDYRFWRGRTPYAAHRRAALAYLTHDGQVASDPAQAAPTTSSDGQVTISHLCPGTTWRQLTQPLSYQVTVDIPDTSGQRWTTHSDVVVQAD